MREYFDLVRPACDFAGVLADSASVNVVNGRMEAFNGVLQISQPVEDIPDFSVAAVELDKALRFLVGDANVKVTKARVSLSKSLHMPRMPDRGALQKPDIETHAVADVADLLGALSDAFAFTVGDKSKPWSEGARFDDETITATNGVMLIQSTLANATPFEGVTIPRAGLAYIMQRGEALSRWGVSDSSILLEFDDGAWALVQRMSMEMPDNAVGILSNINDWTDMRDIDDDFLMHATRTAQIADKEVQVHADHLYGSSFQLVHDPKIATDLGELEGPAVFDPKAFLTVVEAADAVGFDRYPNPVPFTTKRGSRGLIAGLSQN